MIYTIQPPASAIHAKIRLPASKSISNRILILNALSKSNDPIENLSDSDDTQVLRKALLSLQSGAADFDVGAAGTSMRFLTAYLTQKEGIQTITGSERMKNRPIRILADSLREIGGQIEYMEKEGFPPLQIRGRKLTGGAIRLNGGVSSQYLSALMMIAPLTQQGLDIQLEGNIISRPYIDMTARLMQTFGVQVFRNGQHIRIEPQIYQPVPFTVENDWSAASYWYEIAALAKNSAEIELTGLEQNSLQGDAKVAKLFESIVSTDYDTFAGKIIIRKISAKSGISMNYDFTNEPDLAQTLVVTCCLSDIPFHFTGLQSLRIKETDRISALQTELKKLGYTVKTSEAAMEWTGERCSPDANPVISTYEDHRMAMAFAPACLKTEKIRIKDPGVVSKSYPKFWEDLEKAGFDIKAVK
ncbi:MAG: 3-phosphoshikimate 1-carboxyvinyltransferase [Candidatus Azobacteroides sp.]|nr:3-phosphoshikimate 1-carboxyvinyltransferase [Candidatus Azobacteroides sp.]